MVGKHLSIMSAAADAPLPEEKKDAKKEPKARKTKAKEAIVEETADTSCPICLNPFTSVRRRPIECSACHGSVCAGCVENYMLNIVEDPHCPHCRAQWNRAFLGTACTKTFLNDGYYKKRQEILMNREKSYLPQYQVAAERELRARELEALSSTLQHEYNEITIAMNKQLRDLSQKQTRLYTRIHALRSGRNDPADAGAGAGADAEKEKKEAAKFIRRCTNTGCNGFLSTAWKCGLCKHWVCPECFEVKGLEKDTEHTCKPEMVETAKMILKDSKPCPECGEVIQKTSGCDQMWCISCHTPFSWITGRKVTAGVIHNPHYFQWLAKGGKGLPQNPGFVPCGGLPTPYQLQSCLAPLLRNGRQEIMTILRVCNHILDVERNYYQRHLNPANNEPLGVKYLLKELDEEGWKAALARDEKERQKCNEIRDVLDAFIGAAIDIFNRIEIGRIYSKDQLVPLVKDVVKEMEALRAFSMEAMATVSRSFNCSIPFVHEDWEIEHGKPSDLARRFKARKEEEEAVKKRAEQIPQKKTLRDVFGAGAGAGAGAAASNTVSIAATDPTLVLTPAELEEARLAEHLRNNS